MSHWTEMGRSSEGTARYLWEVNPHGDVVITRLDSHGARGPMAAMAADSREELIRSLAACDADGFWMRVGGWDDFVGGPFQMRLEEIVLWANKTTDSRKHLLAKVAAELLPLIEYGDGAYVLTEQGRAIVDKAKSEGADKE